MAVRGLAIVLREQGAAEVLNAEEVEVARPGAWQLLLRQSAAAANYHDVYVRSGLYQTLALPGVPGIEGVGIVEAIGEGVTDFKVGDKVAWVDPAYGGYAQWKLIAAAKAVPVPTGVADHAAAGSFMKGLTALALTAGVHRLEKGNRVLVHAAAGGVGRLVAQLAHAAGCQVIGTAGSAEKAASARAAGCDEVVLYRDHDFAREVARITEGRGVDVVYDAVGLDTFDGSLAVLAPRGHLVLYGQSSGPVPPFDIARLAARSLSLTRASYGAYVDTPAKLRALAAQFFTAVAEGKLELQVGEVFPLAAAARAHQALESRATGPFVLDCR